jgi:hypothetical protein
MDTSSFTFHVGSTSQHKYYHKIIGDYQMIIYVGMWSLLGSVPDDPDLDINNYTSVGVEILDSKSQLLTSYGVACLKLDKLGLNSIYNDSSFRDVSIAQVEVIWILLENEKKAKNSYITPACSSIADPDFSPSPIKENITDQQLTKVGGICKVCGANDPWGYWKDNFCYCYLHTPKN